MKLKCAWCEREGLPATVADVEPIENLSETHGLCADHHRKWLDALGIAHPPPPPPEQSRPSPEA
jgi:hypothetical protein